MHVDNVLLAYSLPVREPTLEQRAAVRAVTMNGSKTILDYFKIDGMAIGDLNFAEVRSRAHGVNQRVCAALDKRYPTAPSSMKVRDAISNEAMARIIATVKDVSNAA